jgi:predicted nuclease of predicted toxin-antitoxin system
VRILADENLTGRIVDGLRDLGHDVMWVRASAPGIRDEQVLALATEERRLLLTGDKYFGEAPFRFAAPAPHGIMLLR